MVCIGKVAMDAASWHAHNSKGVPHTTCIISTKISTKFYTAVSAPKQLCDCTKRRLGRITVLDKVFFYYYLNNPWFPRLLLQDHPGGCSGGLFLQALRIMGDSMHAFHTVFLNFIPNKHLPWFFYWSFLLLQYQGTL